MASAMADADSMARTGSMIILLKKIMVRGEWDPDGGGTSAEDLISKRPSRPSARHRALQCARADQSGCRGPCGVCLEANFGRLRCAWVQLLHWDTLRQLHIA